MLLQTNSYIVPKDKRSEHMRLLQRFRQTLARLGCEHFETYEQVGANWQGSETTGRFVQLMRFRDKRQQQQVQAAERNDPMAQALIREFCELINFPYQQQQGLFAVGFYQGTAATTGPLRQPPAMGIDPAASLSGTSDSDDIDLLAGDQPAEADSLGSISGASRDSSAIFEPGDSLNDSSPTSDQTEFVDLEESEVDIHSDSVNGQANVGQANVDDEIESDKR